MVAETMLDEYHERYRHLGHEELFRMLRAGSPVQVDSVVATWRTVEDAIGSIASTLRADLARLRWSSSGSREFGFRLGLVVSYAQKLADEATAMRTGLVVMSGSLAQAQRRAEPDGPTRLDPRPVPGVLGPEVGHVLAPDEQAKARERIVMVVAQLAAEYAVADHRSWPASIPLPPPGLPGEAAMAGSAPLVDDTAQTPADDESGHVTGLAGAGDLAAATASPAVLSTGPAPPLQPPSTLSGAGAGVVGVARQAVGPSTTGDGRSGQPLGAGQSQGAGQAMM